MKQDSYEITGKKFCILDFELGIDLTGALEFSEKEYFSNGMLRFEAYRKEEHLHGPSIFYDRLGQILSQTWYFEGKKVGKLKRFYSSGQLYCLERFFEGMPHLAQEYFYLDGAIKTIIHYDTGSLHGETKLFWPDGVLKRKTFFSQGIKKTDLFYDEKGNSIRKSIS